MHFDQNYIVLWYKRKSRPLLTYFIFVTSSYQNLGCVTRFLVKSYHKTPRYCSMPGLLVLTAFYTELNI